MKLNLYLVPVLGLTVLAQELNRSKCEILSCPLVKCPSDSKEALCNCLVGREVRCAERCPDYMPDYQDCPAPKPTVNPVLPSVPATKPTTSPKPTYKPVTCECPLVNCLQIWPGSCHCFNTAAQNCYDRCGGPPPRLQDCSGDGTLAPAPEPTIEDKREECVCEDIMCIQSWPESCYCANAAKESCYQKCGGTKPVLQQCPPLPISTLTTLTLPSATPIPILPPNRHQICGGGRLNQRSCGAGYVCIADPYTPGCGPACDGLGICVEDKMCGGFANLPCGKKGQVCRDDPRDDCDPQRQGADCGGLCVWPHRSLLEGGVEK